MFDKILKSLTHDYVSTSMRRRTTLYQRCNNIVCLQGITGNFPEILVNFSRLLL